MMELFKNNKFTRLKLITQNKCRLCGAGGRAVTGFSELNQAYDISLRRVLSR